MPTQGRSPKPARPIVLAVDDDIAVRDALHVLLDDEYEVVDAPDAPAARAALETRPVDAVLLDIMLPGTDGLELLREIRRMHATLPVIMLTGVRTVTTAIEAMRLGALDYLDKPFDIDDVLRAVRRAIQQHRGDRGRRPRGAAAKARPSPYVQKAVEYIAASYAKPLAVASVAKAVGISGSHLAHLFRAETGETVREFIARTRVRAAEQRLTSTDAKLAEIARAVGFCDASHLTRRLVRLTGRRPTSYRRRKP